MKRIALAALMAVTLILPATMASAAAAHHHHKGAIQASKSGLSVGEIQAVQQSLRESGYYRDWQVDGVWGPVTIQATRNYQADKGLKVTGMPDKETLQRLGVNLPRRTKNAH